MGHDIVRRLNELGIPCPSRLHYIRGEMKAERFANAIWHVPIVKIILRSKTYLGHTIQGQRKNDLSSGKKCRTVPEKDWAIAYNTHEPLIDEEIFYKVQEIGEAHHKEHKERSGKFDDLGTTPNV